MSSVKQLLTNAYDPLCKQETDLLTEDDSGLMMIQHSCTAAMVAISDMQLMSQKKYDEIKNFKELVMKARQLRKDEDN